VRVALEDIDDVGGKKIPKGESVLCLLGSANRDPAVYPDRPDRLDITRPNVKPLSFRGGIAHCLVQRFREIDPVELAVISHESCLSFILATLQSERPYLIRIKKSLY
jgi:cytochrome P450